MRRMHLVALLGLSLAAIAPGDESNPGTEPKPPWQRLLTGDDARKAADLDQRIADREAADKYAEAIRLREELLALRTRVQGAGHWQTVDEKWDLTAATRVAALPAEKRAGWRRAVEGISAAERLEGQGQYGKALPLWQEGLKWCREVLGEANPEIASIYNGIANNLRDRGKYAEAGPLYQKALEVRRKVLGEEHPATAYSYNGVALSLDGQGKFAEAGTLFRRALEIRRKIVGEDHVATAFSYSNVAANLDDQGKYAEAAPLHQKALDIRRKLLGEEQPDTAAAYNGVAHNLHDQGKYAEAAPLYQKALDIRRKVFGEEHPDTAYSCNGVALNLDAQGKYTEAELLFRRALEIRLKVLGEDSPATAFSYSNLAANLYAQSKHAEAEPLHQKALAIRRKILGEYHPDTATSCNNAAANLAAQGNFAEAETLFRQALEVYRKVLGEDHPLTALGGNNVAANLQAQGKYPEALATAETAARSYEAARLGVAGGLERAAYGAEHSPYPFLAAARGRAGRAADAWAALEADLARGLLDQMALHRSPSLSPAEQRHRDELRARRAPLDARILALVSRSQRTDAETADLERLVAERRQLDQSLADLAAEVSRRELAPLTQLQAALPADAAFVAWVDAVRAGGLVQEHWGCVVRPQGEPRWERLPGSGPEDRWTGADTALPGQLQAALARSAPAAAVAALAQKLHAQRLAPLSKHLGGVRRLVVAPVHWMASVPIEALTDQYTISYTPSGTYLARLKERERPRGRGLLAVGDPTFPPIKDPPPPAALPPGGLLITQVLPGGAAANARLQAGDVLVSYAGQHLTSLEQLGKLITAKAAEKVVIATVWREGQEKLTERELPGGRLGVTLAREPARQALAARRQADELVALATRGERYAELPGTQVEVARLAELFDPRNVTTLTRAAASEQRLDELRRAGKLASYRYLHFATHGKANDVRAFESALLLSAPARPPEVRVGEPYLEGRLTAREVLEYWKLDGELVTLSACESGLGRHGGGDGLLGFAQAFLMAGSRSVCLTLWQVDDTATALLMDRFYRNLLGKRADGGQPMGKAAALREAKQWLRTLTAAEALERLGTLTQGVVRGQRPAREEMPAIPKSKDAGKDYKPYAHPRYWAAFILIGDPE
jgi:tetratricopeptide (TPR) repeat protein